MSYLVGVSHYLEYENIEDYQNIREQRLALRSERGNSTLRRGTLFEIVLAPEIRDISGSPVDGRRPLSPLIAGRTSISIMLECLVDAPPQRGYDTELWRARIHDGSSASPGEAARLIAKVLKPGVLPRLELKPGEDHSYLDEHSPPWMIAESTGAQPPGWIAAQQIRFFHIAESVQGTAIPYFFGYTKV